MINHHPDDNLLTEYASGSLALALGLSVCAHIQLCAQCRARVVQLNRLGGSILNNSVPEAVKENSFAQVMSRIHQEPAPLADKEVGMHAAHIYHEPMLSRLPKVLTRLLPRNGKLKWQRISSALRAARLMTGQNEYEVSFHRISTGGKVVEHDHGGMEVTLVLHGSFSDERGVYGEGDFLVRQPGEVHRPTATQNQDCLCFTVVAAPIKVTGFLGKLVNPFLPFHPA